MKRIISTAAVVALMAGPALALDPELAQLNRTVFDSIDLNGDQELSLREVDLFRQTVMLSQDYDDDGVVTAEEHLEWDMGWEFIAEARGVSTALAQARRDVFDAWDRNGDGALDQNEQTLSQSTDFYAAAGQSDQPLNFEQFTTNLRIIAAMNDAVANETHVTLINVFEVPEGAIDRTIEMWRKSRDFLQTQPGYVSTALHQSIGQGAKFALINVAIWESAKDFQAASAAMRAKMGAPAIEGLSFTPGLYKVIERD